MSWSDPIVEEVRRARDAYAARFHYDLQAIFRDLKEQEKRGGRQVVSYAHDGTPLEANKMLEANKAKADTQAVLDLLTSGNPIDPESYRQIRAGGQQITEDLRQKHGELNIAVDMIREIRDEE